METLRQWVILLCTAAVTSGILTFIIPDGKIRKSTNIVFYLFMLTVLISIFSSDKLFDINFDIPDDNINLYEYDFDSFVQQNANDIVISEIEEVLYGICSEEFSVNVTWERNENVYTLQKTEITVSPADFDSIGTIKSKVGSLTGVIPEVVLKNEN